MQIQNSTQNKKYSLDHHQHHHDKQQFFADHFDSLLYTFEGLLKISIKVIRVDEIEFQNTIKTRQKCSDLQKNCF